jgi:DNA-binding response OmpR family regulator
MTGHTILVVDADQETEEIIIATLETEGYLVFAASGREISSGLAGKISPHLIFLKPTANSVEGFETCKTIHNSELFKTVPIIMLASLRGPLDARYTTYYGIVDYLKMPLSSEELIEKTREILGSASPDLEEQEREETALLTEDMTEKGASVRCEESSDEPEYAEEEIGQTNEEYSYSDERENESRSLRARRGRRRRAQKSGPLSPAFIAMVAIAVLAGAFLS